MGLAVHRITNYYFWKQNVLHEAPPPRAPALPLSGWIWPRPFLLPSCNSNSQRDEASGEKRGPFISSHGLVSTFSDRGEDQVRILRRGQSNEIRLPRGIRRVFPFTAADDEAALSESLAHTSRISCPALPSHRLVSRQLGPYSRSTGGKVCWRLAPTPRPGKGAARPGRTSEHRTSLHPASLRFDNIWGRTRMHARWNLSYRFGGLVDAQRVGSQRCCLTSGDDGWNIEHRNIEYRISNKLKFQHWHWQWQWAMVATKSTEILSGHRSHSAQDVVQSSPVQYDLASILLFLNQCSCTIRCLGAYSVCTVPHMQSHAYMPTRSYREIPIAMALVPRIHARYGI